MTIHIFVQTLWGVIWKHTAENLKPKKCNLCDFASSQTGNLRRHIWKRTVDNSQTNASNVNMHLLMQAIWGDIWKRTMQPMCLCPFPLQKCNLCDFASSRANNLRAHLKTHTGEKSNKCSQCDYASSRSGNSMTHFKMHSEEKSNKCNQWDYACSDPSAMRKHVKDTVEISHTNATNVTLRLLLQVVWGHI